MQVKLVKKGDLEMNEFWDLWVIDPKSIALESISAPPVM